MSRSRHYVLGNAISLMVGGVVFIVGSLILPIFYENFRNLGTVITICVIGVFMCIFGTLFLNRYRSEVKEEYKMYEANEKLKQLLRKEKEIKEQTFYFDAIDED